MSKRGADRDERQALDAFFAGHPESRRIFDALHAAVRTIGSADVRVTKSQVAFRRKQGFAAAWMPDQYLATDTRRWC